MLNIFHVGSMCLSSLYHEISPIFCWPDWSRNAPLVRHERVTVAGGALRSRCGRIAFLVTTQIGEFFASPLFLLWIADCLKRQRNEQQRCVLRIRLEKWKRKCFFASVNEAICVASVSVIYPPYEQSPKMINCTFPGHFRHVLFEKKFFSIVRAIEWCITREKWK